MLEPSITAYRAAAASEAAYFDSPEESIPKLAQAKANNPFHFEKGNCQGVNNTVPHDRYVQANDGVACIPWMLGTYRHCGTLHYITTCDRLWKNPNPIAVFLDR